MKHLTKGSGWIFLSLKIMIAAATMIIIVRNINFNYIYSALIHPQNPRFFILALFLLIPNMALQWYRWHYLLKMSGLSITFWESFSSLLGGLAVGFVTPGRIGEMGRFLFIQKGDPLQAVGLVFIDKLFSFVVILIFGILGLFHFLSVITSRSTFLLWPLFVIVFLVAVMALLIVLHPQWIRHSLYHISLILPYRDKIQRLITSLDHFDGVKAARFLIMTICQYFIYIIQFCMLAMAFQNVNPVSTWTACVSTILAKTLLPISLADLGIREGAAIYFFMKFGMYKVTAFNSSILLFAINVLIPALVGLLFLPRLGWKNGSRSGKN